MAIFTPATSRRVTRTYHTMHDTVNELCSNSKLPEP